MTIREQILEVYKGNKPDKVPYMLDLSHWYYQKHNIPWDLSISYEKPEYELIDYHKMMGIGFYLPNLGSFYQVQYPDDVKVQTEKSADGKSITWTLDTPIGSISRTRIWEDATYAWGIRDWAIKTPSQLDILAYALENRTYKFLADRYNQWLEYIGDYGVCYVSTGYSGMGQLLNYWSGIEDVMYATTDMPEKLKETVDRINKNNLELVKVLADSPVEIVIMGDNFSSDVQPPSFFKEWSKAYYDKAISILKYKGKYVAVHIDGKLAGSLEMFAECGADCADAVTPKPIGDLSPSECRACAGKDLILSGGVSPDLWLPDVEIDIFKKSVLQWLELKNISPRLIANAGDQVPPHADEERIKIMADLVDKHGRY